MRTEASRLLAGRESPPLPPWPNTTGRSYSYRNITRARHPDPSRLYEVEEWEDSPDTAFSGGTSSKPPTTISSSPPAYEAVPPNWPLRETDPCQCQTLLCKVQASDNAEGPNDATPATVAATEAVYNIGPDETAFISSGSKMMDVELASLALYDLVIKDSETGVYYAEMHDDASTSDVRLHCGPGLQSYAFGTANLHEPWKIWVRFNKIGHRSEKMLERSWTRSEYNLRIPIVYPNDEIRPRSCTWKKIPARDKNISSYRNWKLVDDETQDLLAVFVERITPASKKEKGKFYLKQDFTAKMEGAVLLTGVAMVELVRRQWSRHTYEVLGIRFRALKLFLYEFGKPLFRPKDMSVFNAHAFASRPE
ncbi:MAG: hypothetical protein M1814_006064 [Vezdaea aestivalis]|nr:MAG: hypothetical protein M1814_006064 [Vezdaea aestivalis]